MNKFVMVFLTAAMTLGSGAAMADINNKSCTAHQISQRMLAEYLAAAPRKLRQTAWITAKSITRATPPLMPKSEVSPPC